MAFIEVTQMDGAMAMINTDSIEAVFKLNPKDEGVRITLRSEGYFDVEESYKTISARITLAEQSK